LVFDPSSKRGKFEFDGKATHIHNSKGLFTRLALQNPSKGQKSVFRKDFHFRSNSFALQVSAYKQCFRPKSGSFFERLLFVGLKLDLNDFLASRFDRSEGVYQCETAKKRQRVHFYSNALITVILNYNVTYFFDSYCYFTKIKLAALQI
jgi:hypothetical protein